MKNKERCDVVGLSYYIVFYLRKYHKEINVFDLHYILNYLQYYQLQKYGKPLFDQKIVASKLLGINDQIDREFHHYGGYPIESRKTWDRWRMAQKAKKQLPKDVYDSIQGLADGNDFFGYQKMKRK